MKIRRLCVPHERQCWLGGPPSQTHKVICLSNVLRYIHLRQAMQRCITTSYRISTLMVGCKNVLEWGPIHDLQGVNKSWRSKWKHPKLVPWENLQMSLHSPERAHFRCGGEIIENSMFKHMQLHHQDQQPQFVFKAEKFFKDVCSDQIFEGVCINNSPSTHGYLMNSRAGPHPSLNDHHLAQQHQLQQRLLTSYKQLEMPLPYWPQEQ